MISYIRGKLIEIDQNSIIIEAGAIGYDIYVPLSLVERLPKIGTDVLIHTHFQVKEDGVSLYGFLNRQDLSMFRQLIGVNGIGPKGALGVLSVMTPDEVRMAILSEDAKAITKAPGIGLKTAQRVIIDLKDRISMSDLSLGQEEVPFEQDKLNLNGVREAAEALVALGYSKSEAMKATQKVKDPDGKTAEEILKESLKFLVLS